MNIYIILSVAAVLSLAFHFIGVYAGATKVVWLMLVLMWAGAINIYMSEIKPSGYEEIEKMKGQFSDTDALIQEAMPEISIYEMLSIKKSYQIHKPKK